MTDSKNFDFNSIGKRMPYTVPEHSFSDMEKHIWQKCLNNPPVYQRKRTSKMKFVLGSIASIAAVVLLALCIINQIDPPIDSSFDTVEQAFCQLSENDQDFLISIYDNESFTNY